MCDSTLLFCCLGIVWCSHGGGECSDENTFEGKEDGGDELGEWSNPVKRDGVVAG